MTARSRPPLHRHRRPVASGAWPTAGRWWRWKAPSSPTACPSRENAAMAAAVEQIIRDEGAVPATIAVVDGRLKVGLSRAPSATRWRR